MCDRIQAGVERSETPVQRTTTKQNPDGVTEILSYLRHLHSSIIIAGVTCFALHTLPVIFTPRQGLDGEMLCILGRFLCYYLIIFALKGQPSC